MENYFEAYEEILRIPERKKRPKPRPTKFALDYREVIRQQNNILNSTVKTNALLAQISKKRRGFASQSKYEELNRLEPTIFVDELIRKEQLTRDMAGRIPSQEELEERRREEEISPEELGQMVGAGITQQTAGELRHLEPVKNSENASPMGIRIIEGKMPVREMQELTRDRVADLSAEQEYERMIDYDGLLEQQQQFAGFIPRPEDEKAVPHIQELRRNIAEMIINSIPAALIVHTDNKELRKLVENSTLVQYGDLEALASVIQSEQNSLNLYKLYSEPTKADFYHSLYLQLESKAPQKDAIIRRDDYDTEEEKTMEEALKHLEALETNMSHVERFTDEELGTFSSEYGKLFADSLSKIENGLNDSRHQILNTQLQILRRDSEFAKLADKQATMEDSNMLEMGIAEQQIREIEYEAWMEDEDTVHNRISVLENELLGLFRRSNPSLASAAVAELAETSILRHPHLNIEWENKDPLEDFLVEREIPLESDPPPSIESISSIDTFLKDGIEVEDDRAADKMAHIFEQLQIDIHDKLDLFMCVTEDYSLLEKVFGQLNALLDDKIYFEREYAALREQLDKFENEEMRQHVHEEAEIIREEVISRKERFENGNLTFSFVKPQKMEPTIWYDYNADKFGGVGAE